MRLSWPRALEEAGFAPDYARSRAPLLDMAGTRLTAATPVAPMGAWIVPGRIEVVGKHADYAGGRSLVAAVPRGFAVVAAPRTDDRVRVMDARYAAEFELAVSDRDRTYVGWTNYVAVVVRRIAQNFPGAALGVDIAIASDLPRAAGASSSSALVVGIAHALMARAGLPGTPVWTAAIQDELDLASYLGTIENGHAFRTLAGTAGVGTDGGSQDHTAILASRAGLLSAFGYAPVRRLGDAPMPRDWRFIIMTSGVHAGKASDAKDRFNRAARVVAAIVSSWRAAGFDPKPSLAEIVASGPDAVERLRDVLIHSSHSEFTADDLTSRLTHFLAEDARVPDAVAAFRSADARLMGEIGLASQTGASDGLGNQIHETRALASTALSVGAFASSSFGAGFGGCVWGLVEGDDAEADRVAVAWSERYREVCPHVSGVDWFIARPAPGLKEVQSSRS
ncbi:MAG: galactokinase family protein [Acidobacteriota bacterium]